MQNIQVGQTVKNRRTGAQGKVIDFVSRWNAREMCRKVVVEVGLSRKLWALSSCEVIQEVAPRSLALLKQMIERYNTQDSIDQIKHFVRENYSVSDNDANLNSALQYILEDECVTSHLSSVTRFQSTSYDTLSRITKFIVLEFSRGTVHADYCGGVGNMITELYNCYWGLKAQ